MTNLDQAEMSVVGAFILWPDKTADRIMGELNADDFSCREAREIFKACRDIYRTNSPIDPITVINRAGEGNKVAVARACEMVPSCAHTESYIQIVRGNASKRRAYQALIELMESLESHDNRQESLDLAVKITRELSQTQKVNALSAKEGFLNFYQTKMTPKSYIKTGFSTLDRHLFLDRGDYVIVGGRPSSGKTALTLQLMMNLSKEHTVVYFSLETSPTKIFDRLISSYTKTPMREIKTGQIDNWAPIAACSDSFGERKFHVVQAAGMTVEQIKAQAVMLKAEIIFIDYLSLIRGQGKSLYERVSGISIDLHTLAQQNNIMVIALSQLNRAGKENPDMASLRESGQIEQDADVVLMISPKNGDDPDGETRRVDVIVAKNKEGMTGPVKMIFNGSIQTFAELEERYGG